jgi:mRNA export factor
MLVTGSWDKTVKYWDLRQAQPAATLQCQERVYTLDVKDKLLVVGTADRYINVINLNEPLEVANARSQLLYRRVWICGREYRG